MHPAHDVVIGALRCLGAGAILEELEVRGNFLAPGHNVEADDGVLRGGARADDAVEVGGREGQGGDIPWRIADGRVGVIEVL